MRLLFAVLVTTLVLGCSRDNSSASDAFFSAIKAHCGQAFEGRVVSTDPVDADFAKSRLVMEVRSCSFEALRIPFHVDDDHSRTWVIKNKGDGLQLKHDHRHEDGSEDAVTQYGGDAAGGTKIRQEFPVDQFSIDMFKREGLTASVTNVWAMEIDGSVFVYELSRENRFFRVEFDLSKPVENPPPPW